MPRSATPSFVLTLPLQVAAGDLRRLNDRFSCGTRLTNVMIQHAHRLVKALHQNPAWSAIRHLPKTERNARYRALREAVGFTKSEFEQVIAMHAKAARFTGRIGSHEMQVIAEQVFNATHAWLCKQRGALRFKSARRPVHSLSGKNNTGMLQWKAEDRVLQIAKGWQIKAMLPDLNRDEWLWLALQCRTKYCRLLWKTIHGERRWFVQLIQEGLPPIKSKLLENRAAEGTVGGIDLGPGSLAWVSDTGAGLIKLTAAIDRPVRLIRRLQRQIDRQRRAANPDNFKANGQAKRGCTWTVSNRQYKNNALLADLHRQEAAIRKTSHGKLCNFLLTQARVWQDDGVSPKALQKRYGKSVGKCAPGYLMAELTRKAERAGGERKIIDSRHLKTSQYDHTTDDFEKKPLSQRKHWFRDGRGWVQRDVYSAFLAKYAVGSSHNSIGLATAWTEMTSLLSKAGLCDVKTRNDGLGCLHNAPPRCAERLACDSEPLRSERKAATSSAAPKLDRNHRHSCR